MSQREFYPIARAEHNTSVTVNGQDILADGPGVNIFLSVYPSTYTITIDKGIANVAFALVATATGLTGGAGTATLVNTTPGVNGATNAVWTLKIDATGGTFVLKFGTDTALAAIAYDVAAATLATDLDASSSIGGTNAGVTGGTGSGSVIIKVQAKDFTTGRYSDVLTSAAKSAPASTRLVVYPGATAATNVAVSDALPAQWRVSAATTSTGGNTVDFSVGASTSH